MPSESKLFIVGIGPGSLEQMTIQAREAIRQSEYVVGYRAYIDLVKDLLPGKEAVSSTMGREVDRAREAVDLLQEGSVSLISSGDPTIYGMAGLGLEVASRQVSLDRVEVVPGVTSFTSASCLAGVAFREAVAVTSLSDLLTPWKEIEARAALAAEMNIPLAIYNPRSRGRRWQLDRVLEIFLERERGDSRLLLARNVFRQGQQVRWTTVRELQSREDLQEQVDMFTVLLIEGQGMCQGRPSQNSLINLIGTGPGGHQHLTVEARGLIGRSDLLLGPERYLKLVQDCGRGRTCTGEGKVAQRVAGRARQARIAAARGETASLLVGGDPSMFSSAPRIFQENLDLHICPGISAFQGVAARIGAPMANDFAVVSWSRGASLERMARLIEAGFALAVYNMHYQDLPALGEAIPASRPCALARDVSREGEMLVVDRGSELVGGQGSSRRSTLLVAAENSYLKEGRIIARRGYDARYSY
ncbi:MAG: hypothetical protein GKC10_04270 [Methanosarcinales archaeon]|nr:hypothetical protein [Methanosarcinales archaeon]